MNSLYSFTNTFGNEALFTLDHVKSNQFAMITDMSGLSETVRKHLLAYGLFNGSKVRVLSTHPEMIIQIEETELALEYSVAKNIVVEIVDSRQ